jgi:hypothetical protein
MLGIVLSTIAFFMARYYVNRYLDDIGVPKTLTRGLVAFCAALLVAYAIAYIVNWIAP